jgi:hypothetical protein
MVAIYFFKEDFASIAFAFQKSDCHPERSGLGLHEREAVMG